jgi:uncharacterized membrane protein
MFDIPLHFQLVHFPIALTVMAAVLDVRAFLGKRPEQHRTGYVLILWAAAGAALAMLTGLQLLGDRRQSSGATFHAASGLITGLVLIAVSMIRYSAEAREQETAKSNLEPWLVLEVFAALAVIVTALTGHRMVLSILGK